MKGMFTRFRPVSTAPFLTLSIIAYTKFSAMPIKKTLDDFDFSFQPSIDKRQIDELVTMRFWENGENVVFLGPPGVGTTHLA